MSLDPAPFTLAELYTMGRQKLKLHAEQTSAIVTTLLNVNRVEGDPLPLDAFVPDALKDRPEQEPEVIEIPPEEARKIIARVRADWNAQNGNYGDDASCVVK